MKVINQKKHVYYLFVSLNRIFLQKKEFISNISETKTIPITQYDGMLSEMIFYKLNDESILLFDTNLDEIEKIDILKPCGFQTLEKNFYLISYENENNIYSCFHKNGFVFKPFVRIYGKFVNSNYRLNFSEGIFLNPKKFTCSDILGDITYWEYECEQGFQAKNSWIVRGDYLLFCINKQGYFAGKLIKINIKTGVIKWQVDVPYTDMVYDENQGIFISFWAGNSNGKNYQLIDIDNETLEIGEPITDFELANVNTIGQLQYLNATKLFFADNVHSYGNNTVPIKFGCFDIVTKKVDFLQEIPTEYGIQISQIIYNEDKLYIRMTENTLLIYEDD